MMIMGGSREARLLDLRMLDIHGTYYYDMVYQHTDEAQPRQARLGKDDVYPEPQPGDSIRVRYVMNVATAVERAAPADAG